MTEDFNQIRQLKIEQMTEKYKYVLMFYGIFHHDKGC